MHQSDCGNATAQVSPIFFMGIIIFSATLEAVALGRARTADYVPGDLGFDPLRSALPCWIIFLVFLDFAIISDDFPRHCRNLTHLFVSLRPSLAPFYLPPVVSPAGCTPASQRR